MKIQLATPNDEKLLTDFFEKQTLDGNIRYQVRRPSGFFRHTEQAFPDYETYKLYDPKSGEIHGTTSLIMRPGFVEEWQRVIWATDMRLSTNKAAMLHFAENFLQVLDDVKERRNCRHMFTAISKSNTGAFNTLIRPRSMRENMPRFHLLANFYRVAILGRVPWGAKLLSTIHFKHLDASNVEALAAYLEKKTRGRLLTVPYSAELLWKRIESWKGMQQQNFLIAYDSKQNIVGCVAPWDTAQTQQYKVIQYDDFYDNMRRLLKIGSRMWLNHPLTEPGEFSSFYFLTHFHADNGDVFSRLLYEALQFCDPNQHLMYCHFESQHKTLVPDNFLHIKSKFGLYAILSPEEQLATSLMKITRDLLPDLEIAFL